MLHDKLSYEREYIQKFLQDIYSLRGDIVHENQYLVDVLERNSRLKMLDEKFDHPKDVVAEARRFMSASIVAYIDLTENTELSIDEIGELMDEAALGADSSELFG